VITAAAAAMLTVTEMLGTTQLQQPTSHTVIDSLLTSLGGAAVRCRTRDRKVAGSTPGRGAIKSTRSTQPSIPPG